MRDPALHLAALVKQRGTRAERDRASALALIRSPSMAATGRAPAPWTELSKRFSGTVIASLRDQGFRGPFAVADGRVIHNAGGSEAQELAFALACAVAYLRALEAGGMPLDAARRMIYFRLAADADQFLTIAKFRAIRKLWARVEQACGLAPAPTRVSRRNRMADDDAARSLREHVARDRRGRSPPGWRRGCDHGAAVHRARSACPTASHAASRATRSLSCSEESNLAKVSDPAAGSGGIEDLTTQLCEAAWVLFQEIEKAGGAAAALEQG